MSALVSKGIGFDPDPMTRLQDRWYNYLVGTHKLSGNGQILQPVILSSQDDAGLWGQLGLVPPATLTFDNTVWGIRNTFFASYLAICEQLDARPETMETFLGSDLYAQWMAYLATIQPPRAPNQLPNIYRQWAMLHAPAKIQGGMAILNTDAAIQQTREDLAPFIGPDAPPPDYMPDFDSLMTNLNRASSTQILFDSAQIPAGVSDSWASGQQAGVCGLWAGSFPQSRISRQFAAGHVTVTGSIAQFTQFGLQPGKWYNSSLLNMANSSDKAPPWKPDADPNWNDFFGPHGSFLRATGGFVAGAGLTVKIRTSSVFDTADQHEISQQAEAGLWPFYIPGNANTVHFDVDGMTIDTQLPIGTPFLLGTTVLGIGQYLGHGDN